MMGYAGGMGAVGWILMSVVWIALIVLIVWMIVGIVAQSQGLSRNTARALETDTPTDILNRRLAKGEIDIDTYETLRAKLSTTR